MPAVRVLIAVLLLLGLISGIIGAFLPEGSTKSRTFTIACLSAMLTAVGLAALFA